MCINIKAVETVKEHYKKNYEIKSIRVEKLTNDLLEEALKVCNNTKHIEWRTELYDDEERPDWNTWVDIEGEGYGWLWTRERDNEDKWHGLIKDCLLNYIKEKKEKFNENEFVVVVEAEEQFIYHFIEREEELCDNIFTFSDKEIYW